MGLTEYKLGELIEMTDERNYSGRYTLDSVKGISTEKAFIDTKANMDGVSLDSYKVVNPGEFSYVPDTSRRGDKIALAFNNASESVLISSIYTTFRISRNDLLLPEFLYMFFNRPEFDRYSRFNSWGSARETFSWDDFCDIDITLPDTKVQRKYVDVYLALQKNLAAYQSKVDELKLVCDGYIEELRRNMKCDKIGKFITKESKNTDGRITKVLGIGQNGFMEPQKDPNESLRNYKILHKGDIAYAPPLFNILTGALHCYQGEENAVCSPIYEVFKCDDNRLLPEYLTMWLKRDEFIRYAEFYALGVRQTFDYSLMEEVEIPIPNIEIQCSIVNIFRVYQERKAIAAQLKEQLNNLCPILIKGSLENRQ